MEGKGLDYNHVTAKWAREKTKTVLGDRVQKEIFECLAKVEKAVSSNETSTYVSGYLHELTKQELIKRGFNLHYNEGDFRDQRDVATHTIKW